MNTKLQKIEKKMMKERAARLAQPLEKNTDKSDIVMVLIFAAMDTTFGIYLSNIDAVTRINDIVYIPGVPAHIAGVVRKKGRTFALVNLRHFFYPDEESLADEDFAVFVNAENKFFAFQVTDIDGVRQIKKSDIKPVPDSYTKTVASYLDGITSDGCAILNLYKMVNSEGFSTA
jgi:chemotaxis signal transduction protein